MSAVEIRASLSLSSLFALRMLGLFLILPVFAVHAVQMEGGDSQFLVGLALGAYGLTQGLLQIPFGMASDRWGRKRVIVFGLVLFAVGSFVAALATSVEGAIIGRCIQGAGAISAAVVALAADLTRDQHRTKVMALIGGSISLTFALSLMLAPALYRAIGMDGIFALIGVMALAAILVVLLAVPPEPRDLAQAAGRAGGALASSFPLKADRASLGSVLRDTELLRLNFGIFALHGVQMAMFVVVPTTLVASGHLPVESHWKVYLPVVLVSFALMMPPILVAERRGQLKRLFIGSVMLMLALQAGFALWLDQLPAVIALLVGFFIAFNILEATLPSLVTRIAPASARGTAIGVYNTTQALGLFFGGALGGLIAQHGGNVQVFAFGIVLMALWLVVAAGMKVPGQVTSRTLKLGPVQDVIALRERLVRVRGVRDVVVMPEQGIAVLTVFAGAWDEQAALRTIGGEA
ncbi:MAG: MFS transporter [Betaproteobacteria bacterium]|nr:MFS transporter [Betaproteobacteria bacterium]